MPRGVGRRVLALLLAIPGLQTVQVHQTTVEVAPTANLQRLTAERTAHLTASLTTFVRHAEHPEADNPLVADADRATTVPLLDELRDLCRHGSDDGFFVPYLTTATPDGDDLRVQLTYAGVLDGKPVVRAIVELVARAHEDGFTFASPLARDTAGWHEEPHGAQTLCFAEAPDADRARRFFATIAEFDERLGQRAPPGRFYVAHDFGEAARLVGLVYHASYAGRRTGALAGHGKATYVFVDGCYLSPAAADFDPHDLWHDRLHLVEPAASINRPVDEGCAYRYGGSWGFTWPEILTKFRAYANAHPDADWLALYDANFNFDPRGRFPLHVDYAINALLIERLERDRGFAPVRELLTCGPREPGNANYFARLEKVTGITRATFATKVAELLRER